MSKTKEIDVQDGSAGDMAVATGVGDLFGGQGGGMGMGLGGFREIPSEEFAGGVTYQKDSVVC
jgi:hypothetical protein